MQRGRRVVTTPRVSQGVPAAASSRGHGPGTREPLRRVLPSWEGRPWRPILLAAESPDPEVGPAAGGPEARTGHGAEGGAGELTASCRGAACRAAPPTKGAPLGGRLGGCREGPGSGAELRLRLRFCRGEPRLPPGGPRRPGPGPRPAAQQLPPAHTRTRAPGAGARQSACEPRPWRGGGLGAGLCPPTCAAPAHVGAQTGALRPVPGTAQRDPWCRCPKSRWARLSPRRRQPRRSLGSPRTRAYWAPRLLWSHPHVPGGTPCSARARNVPREWGGRTCFVLVVERGTGTVFQAGSAVWSPLALEAPRAQEDNPSLPPPECLGAGHSRAGRVRPRTSGQSDPVPFRLPGWPGEMPRGGGGL